MRLSTSIVTGLLMTLGAAAGSATAEEEVPQAGVTDAEELEEGQVVKVGGLEVTWKDEGYEYVKMTTSEGDIYVELDSTAAPISVENFLSYVDAGFYDDTIFHRVMANFVVQGGGFDENLQKKATRDPIKNEWRNGLKNNRGTIAMARTNDPDSATSQFYFNVVDNGALDNPRGSAAYAVFGRIVEGLDVLDTIRNVPVGSRNGMQNVPNENVMLFSATRVTDPAKLAQFKEEGYDERRVIGWRARLERADAEWAVERVRRRSAMPVAEQVDQAKALLREKGFDTTGGTTTDSGLWYMTTRPGGEEYLQACREQGVEEPTWSGPPEELPSEESVVMIHYTGFFIDDEVFDKSRRPNSTKPSIIPANSFVTGFKEGILQMKRGEKRLMIIPPELGYGEEGRGKLIPPNSTLIFEVELMDFR